MTAIKEVLEAIQELQEDATIPKNIKTKLEEISEMLKSDEDISIRINKALHELDEISDDTNIQPYARTQIWNIASMLESIQS